MNYFMFFLLLCATWAQAQSSNGRLKVGEVYPAAYQTAHPYAATTDGRVIFEQEFYNKKSAYIKLYFEDFDLGPDDYVEISTYNTGESVLYAKQGKIVDKEGTMTSNFWSGILFDERITVRLHTQSGSNKHSGFKITKVAYGYSAEQLAALMPLSSKSNNCDDIERIACATTVQQDKAKAVCRLFINGMYGCTGWLLGNDGHVMTNEHCITNTTEAQNTDFVFNDQYVSCNTASMTKAVQDVVATSSTIVKSNAAMDYCLLKLPVNPTGTYGYLQLDEDGPSNHQQVYLIHHPGGRPKSITSTSPFGLFNQSRIYLLDATEFYYYAEAEGGSSGSPVLNFYTNKVLGVNAFGGGCTSGSASPSNLLITDLGSAMPREGIPGAIGYVNAFPYQESFETGTPNTWRQTTDDTHDWTITSTGTPSYGTGPSGAFHGFHYAYVESSSPHFNKTAHLSSPIFNLANLAQPALSFKYHMYGADMGGLALQISVNNTSWTTIWNRWGDRNNQWRQVYIDLIPYLPSGIGPKDVQFRFVGMTGNGYRSDVAIDDIRVYSTFYTLCNYGNDATHDFEDDLDGWKYSTSTFFRWGQQSGYSPQANGPSGAHSGLDYLHIHTDNNIPGLGVTAALESTCFTLNSYTNPSLSFWYNIPGIHYPGIEYPGALELYISTDFGATWTPFWSRNYGTSGQWTKETLSLSGYNTQTVKFKFVGTANSGYNISLDLFKLYSNNLIIVFKEGETDPAAALPSLTDVAPTLAAYPNPFTQQLQVETTLPNVQGYRLLNLQGQVVQVGDFPNSSMMLDVYDLPTGVYFLTLYNEETQLVQRVIKQ